MRQVTITLPVADLERLGEQAVYTRTHEAAALLLGTTGDLVDMTDTHEENDSVSMTFVRALALVGAA